VKVHDRSPTRKERHLAVFEEIHAAGMLQESRNVRCHKTVHFVQTQYERRAVPGGDEGVRIIGGNEADGKAAAQLPKGSPSCLRKRSPRQHRFNQMSDDFRIGFGDEPVIAFCSLVSGQGSFR